METVTTSLAAMGIWQLVLASIFLSSYAWALGEFAGAHGRSLAITIAMFAGLGFVRLTDPWQAGVILISFLLIGMGVFAGTAWALWRVTSLRPLQATAAAPGAVGASPLQAAAGLLREQTRAWLRTFRKAASR